MRAKFEIDGTVTNKVAENKKTTKSVNISICFKFFKVIWIVSLPFIVRN